jgi:predicted Zn-ribbon and HTH transcriptional regulator
MTTNQMTAIVQLTCLRCGAEWWPRTPEKPKTCPKCRSPYWDTPRKDKTPTGEK